MTSNEQVAQEIMEAMRTTGLSPSSLLALLDRHYPRTDVEAALAECEREKERFLQSGRIAIDAGEEIIHALHQEKADLENKLAAARECQRGSEFQSPDWCKTHNRSIWRCLAGLAALTEAGEQPRKELSFDNWADVAPVLSDDKCPDCGRDLDANDECPWVVTEAGEQENKK